MPAEAEEIPGVKRERNMHILGEYEQMERKRTEYMELLIRLETEINALSEVASSLRIPWEGDACKAYIIRLNADALIISGIMKRLYDAGELLGEAIDEYQRNEREISELIEAMVI